MAVRTRHERAGVEEHYLGKEGYGGGEGGFGTLWYFQTGEHGQKYIRD